jgi:hypothetical protein
MYECTSTGWREPIQGAQFRVFHINPVRDAKSPFDTIQDCLNNNVCSTLLSAAAAYVGVPPNALSMLKAGAYVYNAVSQPGSEETKYHIQPPPDYKICRVDVRTLSVLPNTGDRASLLSLTAKSAEIGANAGRRASLRAKGEAGTMGMWG